LVILWNKLHSQSMLNTNIYNLTFVIDESGNQDFTGFSEIKTREYFEPGWDFALLWHDMFEHWFEYTDYFSTSELSNAGECVAMGIRDWFDNSTGLVSNFGAFNKYRGCEWNSWVTCLSQIQESSEDYSCYSNNFKYTTFEGYNKKNNDFEGMFKAYNEYKLSKKYEKKIEKAFTYGNHLANKIFKGRVNEIEDFCNNLKHFLDSLEITKTDTYEKSIYNLHGKELKFNFRKDTIIADFCNCKISSKMSSNYIEKQIVQFQNKYYD
jgi:hypothetical protein